MSGNLSEIPGAENGTGCDANECRKTRRMMQ